MISSERPLVQTISDKMQSGYRYVLTEPEGQHFDPLFQPDLTPKQMLFLGIFGGRYMTDCIHEYPSSWFENAKLCSKQHDPRLNYFLVNASQPLRYWQEKGWIYHEDPRGWFQWYCRYYLGRRIPFEDRRQITRWKSMKRHVSQLTKHCAKGDIKCRPKQRQALLHWAYDSRVL